jgi:flagellar motor component MotA
VKIYDEEFSAILSLSEDDRTAIQKDIDTLVSLSRKARADGLLALDEDAESASPGLLRLGLRLVVDGTDPEIVRRTCWIAIHAGAFGGAERVRRLVLLEGIMGIQAGHNPTQLGGMLSAYLGEDAAVAALE